MVLSLFCIHWTIGGWDSELARGGRVSSDVSAEDEDILGFKTSFLGSGLAFLLTD